MKVINSYCDQTINPKLTKRRLRQIKIMKIRYKIICLLGFNKIKWLKKNKVFYLIGEKVLYQPNFLPNNPQLIKIHNNVKIAADVTFYEHDVINTVFQNIDKEKYITHHNAIEIFDNVFIGGKSIIVGNISIGPNSIVAAGSVVTKNVPEGKIVAGNPAKIIGDFEDLHRKRKKTDTNKSNIRLLEHYEDVWNYFYKREK